MRTAHYLNRLRVGAPLGGADGHAGGQAVGAERTDMVGGRGAVREAPIARSALTRHLPALGHGEAVPTLSEKRLAPQKRLA